MLRASQKAQKMKHIAVSVAAALALARAVQAEDYTPRIEDRAYTCDVMKQIDANISGRLAYYGLTQSYATSGANTGDGPKIFSLLGIADIGGLNATITFKDGGRKLDYHDDTTFYKPTIEAKLIRENDNWVHGIGFEFTGEDGNGRFIAISIRPKKDIAPYELFVIVNDAISTNSDILEMKCY